ncbi:plexin cytoplasmic region [Ancylostoma ceylanicum]|uniref:Plexin cytoplasmic region n=1 Tax=Ancylostoma ceylanicum TaxID=53326 RepID=A0A0D6LAD4_9BILA|nr:plexin cytoplasmic region [Ancylostoma ceylanicum]
MFSPPELAPESALFADLNFLPRSAELTTFLVVHVKLTKIAWLRANQEFCGENASPSHYKSKSPSNLEQYDRRSIGDERLGSRIQQIEIRGTTIYAVLPNGLVTLPLASCHTLSSCSACISSPDPMCQWCPAVGKCSAAMHCSSATVSVCPEKNGPPSPASMSIDDPRNISLPVKHLPQPDGFKYVCKFRTYSSPAVWTEAGASCTLPRLRSSKALPASITDLLVLTTSAASSSIIEHNFTVYNCGAFRTSVDTGCDWCTGTHKCVSRGSCTEDTVKCAPMRLSYLDPLPNVTVPLEFVQGEDVIDSTEGLYSLCAVYGDSLPQLFQCPYTPVRYWQLTAPRAFTSPYHGAAHGAADFSPTSGPTEGGTEITIHGRDLGSAIEDVKDRVFVAGSRCSLISYEISKKIVCRVEKGSSSGPIRIAIGRTSTRAAESVMLYSFVEVTVFSAYPLFGPVSGGTKITLHGQNLDAGSNVTVQIGNAPCNNIVRNSTSSLTCIVTSTTSTAKAARISVAIDEAIMMVPNTFEFRPDPSISSVYPLISFKSGGRTVTVEGANFDAVLTARMFFVSSTAPPFEVVSRLSSCQIQNSTFMFCLTPELLPGPYSRTAYARFPVGFAMENVTSVRNLGHRVQMRVVPDPEFAPFKGIRIHQGDQPLILDGRHLNEAAEPQDYKIFVGSERCYVTLVDSRQLVCTGPTAQPEATDERGNPIAGGLPLVSVTVGRLRTELGLIEYVDPIATLRLWVLVVTALTALCSVLVLLAFLWKKRRAERERDYRKIQMQMEHLESNVRKECKQAFAELQTTMETCGEEDYEGMDVTAFPEFLHRLLWEDNGWTHSTSLYASTLPVTLAQFDALLSSKQFVFSIVETAESEPTMSPGEKSMLSSLLVAVLLRNFQYCTDIVLSLLRAHIAKSVHAGNSELLFRKSDSVVEKMVAKWLTICLYDSISQYQAHKYNTLFKALKYQTERGPVDAVTGNARYTINESKLLREIVDCSYVDCLVTSLDGRGPYTVRAIACDTISQLKQKILDHIFKRTPHSQRPALTSFDLDSLADSGKSSWSSLDRSSPVYPPSRFCHLSSPSRTLTMEKKKKIDESIPKSIPEVYLTRLLTSKGTVQKYIEDFLESVLFLESCSYPPILKRVFDLLEEEAARNGVSDHQLTQQWKSNLYILRVWVHLIKNPKILLDVSESISQDGNLSVIAQTLEVARLRPLSSDLFRRIRRQPPICEEAFVESLNDVANDLRDCTRSTVALSELLTWVRGNGVRLVEVLSADDVCTSQRLPSRLSQVINLSLDPTDHIYSTILDDA